MSLSLILGTATIFVENEGTNPDLWKNRGCNT